MTSRILKISDKSSTTLEIFPLPRVGVVRMVIFNQMSSSSVNLTISPDHAVEIAEALAEAAADSRTG